jgi:dihydroxy-acid dehydratase
MSSALEVLGMSLPYSSSIPAVYQGKFQEFCQVRMTSAHVSTEKAQECYRAAQYMKRLLELDLKPK